MLHTPNDISSDKAPRDRVDPIIALYQKGAIQDTLSQAQQLIQEYPDTASIHNVLGACLSHTGPNKKSLYHFKEALKLEPSNSATYNNLGNILIDLQQYEEAQKILEYAIKIKPEFVEAHSNLGVTLGHQKRYPEAIQCFEKAIELNPDFAEAYNNLGNVLMKLKDYEKARDHYTKAIQINPKYAEAYNNLGTALNGLKTYEKAKKNFQNALRLNPNLADAFNNLGHVLEKEGNSVAAIENYKQAVKINPNHAEAFNNMGNAFGEKGDLEPAIECYKKALKINPDLLRAYINLGNLHFRNCKYQESKYYFDSLSDETSVAKSLQCLYNLEKYDEFNALLAKITQKDPANIRVAATSAFAAQQLQQKNLYPFCKDAIGMIKPGHLKNHISNYKKFVKDIMTDMNSQASVWEPKGVTTKQGFQTTENLFAKPNHNHNIARLEEIIKKELDCYHSEFKSCNQKIIAQWPDEIVLEGWYVRLIQNGHQESHIHPGGWVSGVVYLKTVESPHNHEGAIEFGLHGDNYPIKNDDYARWLYQPSDGDIILFPSSLFHKTIPVINDVERCVIAFDLLSPKTSKS